MNFDFADALKDLVEAVKNVLQEMAKAFSELVETLTRDNVYYQYVHSEIEKRRSTNTAVVGGGGAPRTVNISGSIQSQQVEAPKLAQRTERFI